MRALALTDPCCYFMFVFHSFITKMEKIGRGTQISIIKFDWLRRIESKTSRFQGEPLTARPPHLWHVCAHWVSHTRMIFCVIFTYLWLLNYTCLWLTWIKIKNNQLQIVSIWCYNRNVFFFIRKRKSSGSVRTNARSAGLSQTQPLRSPLFDTYLKTTSLTATLLRFRLLHDRN